MNCGIFVEFITDKKTAARKKLVQYITYFTVKYAIYRIYSS